LGTPQCASPYRPGLGDRPRKDAGTKTLGGCSAASSPLHGPSDHTQVPTPGAYVYPGLPPGSLTPDLAVRGRLPNAQWDLVADWAARQHPPITPTGTAAAKMQQPHRPSQRCKSCKGASGKDRKDAVNPILSKDALNKEEPARPLGLFPPYADRTGRGARDHAESLAVAAFCLHTQRQSHKEGYGIEDGKDKDRNGEAASPRSDLFHSQRFRPLPNLIRTAASSSSS